MELSDLGAVTLISGKNNSGKSSVLEGIFLALNYRSPDSFFVLNNIRGLPKLISSEVWLDSLFHNLQSEYEIEINLDIDTLTLSLNYSRDDFLVPAFQSETLSRFDSSNNPSYSLKFKLKYGDFLETGHFILDRIRPLRRTDERTQPPALLPIVRYVPASRVSGNIVVAEVFSNAELKNKKTQILEILKIIDDSISDITTVVSGNQSQLYANVHGRWLPLRLAGDGFDRLLLIIASLIAYPGSILLIDEIESGFHYSVYDKFWEAVMTVAKEQKCQVIATTHSYECLESAVNQAKNTGMGDDFCYFRLGRNKKGEPVAYRLSQDLLAHATDNDLEVR